MPGNVSIMHVGDVHAGYRQYGYVRRALDIEDALRRIVDAAVAQKVDLVVFPGDLYDSTHPPPETVLVVRAEVNRLRSAGIGVFAIDGNHDMSGSSWMRLSDIGPGTEVLQTEHGFAYRRLQWQGFTMVGFDYMRASQIKAALQDWALAGTKADVLVLHQGIFEAAPHMDAGELSTKDILAVARPAGVRYVAMGHYHDFKMFSEDGVVFCYPGSIERTAVNEAAEKKVALVSLERGASTAPSVELVRIPGRPFAGFDIRSEEDVEKFREFLDAAVDVPFVHARYDSSMPDVAARLEAAIGGRFMFRFVPATAVDPGDGMEWAKEAASESLTDLVSRSYAGDTAEHELILQLLANPGNLANIVKAFLKGRGLELSI